ncbi:conserved hypothetical protein [Culex quinquefasciatus]|uniref:Uncharacterized protein n=1 Tax=Culex quinquefasciatus TaxID=7176 RepID=B0XB47_CULQU|nr:conserved hypothetical protein [Culex quinquefasciatus]|eukprot:XP_001866869.1 conserved hypothetical protein [Culex quinquefasciatus]
MEIMEEGNLMDRIPILLQRDLEYYEVLAGNDTANQKVLQENICPGVVGGKLDFPRSASFASVKIVKWLEDEYFAAYRKNSGLLDLDDVLRDNQGKESDDAAGCGGIVKSSDPEKFVLLVVKSVDNMLEHLHTLSQEALDHADLTVLTATIGASALIKNSLFIWLGCVTKNVCPPKGDEKGGSLKMSYKQYSEMTEALAERLLDLHCRLLTMYIIQDADSLHWESQHPFFESERGSYTVQLWWLYMQGTKQDLWSSVPPTMAQRVFAGMLNETLTVLTVRYTQTVPSRARSTLLLVDISNILLCAGVLLPAICENGEAFVGLNISNQSKIIRDIHSKCQELFCCLLLRGVPLGVLYKITKKGVNSIAMFNQRQGLITPWTIFALPKLFPTNQNGHWATRCSELPTNTALSLELKVLLAAPQANWWLILKALLMREAHLSSLIFHHLIKNVPSGDNYINSSKQPSINRESMSRKCDGFLCGLECNDIVQWSLEQKDPIGQTNYQVLMGLTYIVIIAGKTSDVNRTLISALEKSKLNDWASCLDRRQVWNQKRPPWLEAILHLVYPILDPIIPHAGRGCSKHRKCLPGNVPVVVLLFGNILPAEIRPLGDSVLIQVLYMALYSKLLEAAESEAEAEQKEQKESKDSQTPPAPPPEGYVSTINMKPRSVICQTLAEAICFIDEDNKHTEQLNSLIAQARESQRAASTLETEMEEAVGLSFASTSKIDELDAFVHHTPSVRSEEEFDVENAEYIAELLVSDVVVSAVGKLSMKMIYQYIRKNIEWILQQLGVSDVEVNPQPNPGQNIKEEQQTLIDIMFHIGNQSFDQLLSGQLDIDYNSWFQTPMSMSAEKAWLQVSQRWEFQPSAKLSVHEALMVSFITSVLKP